MPQLSLPDTPIKILANKHHNDQESQIMAEGNSTYFIDRYEYPEKGGILVYKYGGILEAIQIDPSKYEQSGKECQEELKALLKKYDFDLMGQDNLPVLLIPNEVIRLDSEQKIKDRVDLKFPEKGFPDPLAVSLANKVKRVLRMGIDFFSYKWTIVAFSLFVFLPYKIKIKILERWLSGWVTFGHVVVEPRIMEPKYYTEFSRETLKLVEAFLINIGISSKVSYQAGWLSAEIMERDNAYRWRLEDLMSETSVQKLISNPRLEIQRILDILHQREKKSEKLKTTASRFTRILLLLFYIPKFKKAWIKALQSVEFKNFQYDDIDRHTFMRYKGYDFEGIPYETRLQSWNNLYNGNPPKIVRIKA